MADTIKARLGELTERAARRTMTIRKAEELGAWELSNPWRVVCHGTLDNIDAWLTAAEGYSR